MIHRNHLVSRLIGCALAFSVVFSTYGMLKDRTEHLHAICPEHGEIIHVHADHAHSADHADTALTAAVAASEPSHEEHLHCAWSAARRTDLRDGAEATALFGRVAGDSAPLPAQSRAAVVAVATYRLAPKTSPPAAS